MEISLTQDNGLILKKENFVLLKSFNELKFGELTYDVWQIKNYNINLTYEFRCNVLIESPIRIMRNKIPLPNNDTNKKKIGIHDRHNLDCDSKKLKRISLKKLSSSVSIFYYIYHMKIKFFIIKEINI